MNEPQEQMTMNITKFKNEFVGNSEIVSLEDEGIASHQVVSIACARNHMRSEITRHSLKLQQTIREYISDVTKEVAEEVILAQITLHV